MYYRIKDIFKQFEFLFNLKYRYECKEYRTNLSCMKNTKIKSFKQIKEEIEILKKYWKCEPDQYIRYKLFEKNLSKEELLDYVPPYYFYVKYLLPRMKNIDKDKYSDKLFQIKLFKNKNISSPKTVAIYKDKKFVTLENQEITINNLINEYLKNESKKLFFKPCNGAGGNNILVLKKKENSLICNNENIDIENFLTKIKKNTNHIIQIGLKQRDDISKINPTSINTLRVITQIRNEKPEIDIVIMRVGRQGKEVDNSAQGGISVFIDKETGSFADFAYAEHDNGKNIYFEHPDTKFVFKGEKINNWEKIKKQILENVKLFPELKSVAWDVAIIEGGISIIEFNLNFGIDHLQISANKGMRKILKIK